MIDVEGLKLTLGDGPLFDGFSFRITIGQRIALAGRNGQGKSTLMKVMLGLQGYDGGTVSVAKGRTLGYLPQDITPPDAKRSAVEETLLAIPQLPELEKTIAELTEALSATPDDEALLARYGRAQSEFEALDGYGLESRARTILDGLGFSQARMASQLDTLSGGWLMRVYLAKLLLSQPDLLLLDEPTNHLDIETREWLLEFLKGFEGAILLTSHDRYFLDHLVSKVFELESGKLDVYHGNYSRYEIQRAENIARLKNERGRQERELKRQQEFIERNRAKAATASNVQSRIKQVAKIALVQLPPEPPSIKLRFPEPPSSGNLAFRLHQVSKSYGDLQVFRPFDLEAVAGEKLAVVGVNGAGKTTLLKLLAERADPTEGRVELGHNITMQYFSQYEDQLPAPEYSLLQAMEEAAPPECTISRRTILGCFLFSDDAVHKPIGVLSGGERARLKLARMLLVPSNLLVLDEPTNHLDLHSKGILLNALKAFQGTVIFVSHDREFLAALATQVLEIKDGRAVLYPDDYETYRWRLAQNKVEAAAAAKEKKPTPDPQPRSKEKEKRSQTKAEREAARRRTRQQKRDKARAQKRFDEVQADIEAKEARLQELERLMGMPGFFDEASRSAPVVTEHKHLQVEIEMGYEELEQALAALEAFE